MPRIVPLLSLFALSAGAACARPAGRPADRLPLEDGRVATALKVVEAGSFGRVLADQDGRALYAFEMDPQGGEASACQAECAAAWPPARGDPPGAVHVLPPLDPNGLETVRRPDGTEQLAYRGRPLYYYVNDISPGRYSGQALRSYGAPWYLLSPDGRPITRESGAQP